MHQTRGLRNSPSSERDLELSWARPGDAARESRKTAPPLCARKLRVTSLCIARLEIALIILWACMPAEQDTRAFNKEGLQPCTIGAGLMHKEQKTTQREVMLIINGGLQSFSVTPCASAKACRKGPRENAFQGQNQPFLTRWGQSPCSGSADLRQQAR